LQSPAKEPFCLLGYFFCRRTILPAESWTSGYPGIVAKASPRQGLLNGGRLMVKRTRYLYYRNTVSLANWGTVTQFRDIQLIGCNVKVFKSLLN
jgi:hypothetical protein